MSDKPVYLSYRTTEGDTWDAIAFRYYGDAHRYAAIIRANPQVPVRPVLPTGTLVAIPMMDPVRQPEELPPWMR